jgi:hypothetical protein
MKKTDMSLLAYKVIGISSDVSIPSLGMTIMKKSLQSAEVYDRNGPLIFCFDQGKVRWEVIKSMLVLLLDLIQTGMGRRAINKIREAAKASAVTATWRSPAVAIVTPPKEPEVYLERVHGSGYRTKSKMVAVMLTNVLFEQPVMRYAFINMVVDRIGGCRDALLDNSYYSWQHVLKERVVIKRAERLGLAKQSSLTSSQRGSSPRDQRLLH